MSLPPNANNTLFWNNNLVRPGLRGPVEVDETYFGGRRHQSVKHSVLEYVRGMAHTNGVESF